MEEHDVSEVDRDAHGQPRRGYNNAAVEARSVDELIGICRGVLADGAVTESEAGLLLNWMQKYRTVSEEWPINMLYGRIASMSDPFGTEFSVITRASG